MHLHFYNRIPHHELFTVPTQIFRYLLWMCQSYLHYDRSQWPEQYHRNVRVYLPSIPWLKYSRGWLQGDHEFLFSKPTKIKHVEFRFCHKILSEKQEEGGKKIVQTKWKPNGTDWSWILQLLPSKCEISLNILKMTI